MAKLEDLLQKADKDVEHRYMQRRKLHFEYLVPKETKGKRKQYVDFRKPELIIIRSLSPQYGDITLCCFGVPVPLSAFRIIVDDLP